MKNVTILGSTGSIGASTLSVIAKHPERFRIEALTAHRNMDALFDQCQLFRPHYAVLVDSNAALTLSKRLKAAGLKTQVLVGEKALSQVAEDDTSDIVVSAIVGAAGLLPTLAAVRAGKRVLLANKEALVMSGSLLMEAVKEGGAELLPVDSEHNAILQCMPKDFLPGRNKAEGVKKIVLTASGGPFRSTPLSELDKVTPEQAIAHPNWSMGPKISVDSATMMNKGLEVIEAFWLFHLPVNLIDVVIHPQSIIHSMVSYLDGSVLAQLGQPDMCTPISHALAWPKRIVSGAKELDLVKMGRLEFQEVPLDRYPCLQLVYQALQAGGTAMSLLNAANEVAVSAFLGKRIGFTEIPQIVKDVLNRVPVESAINLDAVLTADAKARQLAEEVVSRPLKIN